MSLEGEREARRQAEQRSAQADERARAVEREHQRLAIQIQIQIQQTALDQAVREVEAAKKSALDDEARARKADEEAAELRGG